MVARLTLMPLLQPNSSPLAYQNTIFPHGNTLSKVASRAWFSTTLPWHTGVLWMGLRCAGGGRADRRYLCERSSCLEPRITAQVTGVQRRDWKWLLCTTHCSLLRRSDWKCSLWHSCCQVRMRALPAPWYDWTTGEASSGQDPCYEWQWASQ